MGALDRFRSCGCPVHTSSRPAVDLKDPPRLSPSQSLSFLPVVRARICYGCGGNAEPAERCRCARTIWLSSIPPIAITGSVCHCPVTVSLLRLPLDNLGQLNNPNSSHCYPLILFCLGYWAFLL